MKTGFSNDGFNIAVAHDFYKEEICMLHNQWTKCINGGRDYFEKETCKIFYN